MKAIFSFSFIFILSLFISQVISAQNITNSNSQQSEYELNDSSTFFKKVIYMKSQNNFLKSNLSIPANSAFCNTAFFCRQELKLEKAIKVPVKFRLGSLEQCNFYEGKR